MRYDIKGFHFQRNNLIAFLRRDNRIEFEVSPAFIHAWADSIYTATTYNFVDAVNETTIEETVT